MLLLFYLRCLRYVALHVCCCCVVVGCCYGYVTFTRCTFVYIYVAVLVLFVDCDCRCSVPAVD